MGRRTHVPCPCMGAASEVVVDVYYGPQAVTYSGNRLAVCLLPGGGWWILGFSLTWDFHQTITLVRVPAAYILMVLCEAVSRGCHSQLTHLTTYSHFSLMTRTIILKKLPSQACLLPTPPPTGTTADPVSGKTGQDVSKIHTAVQHYYSQGLAFSTQNSYLTRQKHYLRFCNEAQKLHYLLQRIPY